MSVNKGRVGRQTGRGQRGLRKTRLHATAVALVCLAGLSGCGHSQTAAANHPVPADAQKVQATASNFKWTLSRTTFSVGKPIDFVVRASENAHGFSIVGTNISQEVVQGQKPINVVWTPQKAGQYIIRCDVPCGSGHYKMFTRINVK